jgi:hypothetical protein
MARRFPAGLNATEYSPYSSPMPMAVISLPVRTFQSCTDAWLAAARIEPSGLNAAGAPLLGMRAPTQRRAAISHTRTGPLAGPIASVLPSGLNTKLPAAGMGGPSGCRVAAFHSRIDPLPVPAAIVSPSGLNCAEPAALRLAIPGSVAALSMPYQACGEGWSCHAATLSSLEVAGSRRAFSRFWSLSLVAMLFASRYFCVAIQPE